MDQIEKKLKQLHVQNGKQTKNISKYFLYSMVIVVFFALGRGIAYFSNIEKKSPEPKVESQELEKEETEVYLLDENGNRYKIVIDAGHGGRDPGKVSENQLLEKDINLVIATKLGERLEKEGIQIVKTRDSDEILCKETDRNQKMTDLNNRIQLIKDNTPNFVISIHQNSFTDSSVSGAQVFYLSGDEKGKNIARHIQDSLNENISFEKPREIKGNGSYYLLKKCPITTVIVECGFLSNPEEANKLADESYQQQLVDAISEGLLNYFENGK